MAKAHWVSLQRSPIPIAGVIYVNSSSSYCYTLWALLAVML